jgi:ABC-type iron transport system FetAB ATPase subunit/GNAT superfamily N-acetyltransferase
MATNVPNVSAAASTCSSESTFPMIDRTILAGLRPDTAALLTAYGCGGLSSRRIAVASLPTSLRSSKTHVHLITGPSGSGKSQTIPLLLVQLGNPQVIDPTPLLPDRPVIEQWPNLSAHEAAALLARVGMADPVTWARRPGELSVGQQQRLHLARCIQGEGDIIVIDEWLACIDRLTARAVAWATGRLLAKLPIGAILVTAHDDLTSDLIPDVHIRVGWTPEPSIDFPESNRGCSSVVSELTHRVGTRADWLHLAPLHYAAGDPATFQAVHVAEHPDCSGPAAVAVMSWPDLHSAARALATHDGFKIRGRPDEVAKLNRSVAKLSRIVVTPELRGVGVARWLIARVIDHTRAQYVECVTAMGRYSPFLAACGFREVIQTASTAEAALQDWATRSRVPATQTLTPETFADWIGTLSVRGQREARSLVWMVYHQLVLWRRTQKARPRRCPGPNDPRWPEAFDVAARRLVDRPSYWVYGPIDQMTGLPDSTQAPALPAASFAAQARSDAIAAA